MSCPHPHPHLELTSAQFWWWPIPPNVPCCNLSLRILFQSRRGRLFGFSFALILTRIWGSYLPLVMLPWYFSSSGLEVIFKSDLSWCLEATLKEVEQSNAASKICKLSNSSPLRFWALPSHHSDGSAVESTFPTPAFWGGPSKTRGYLRYRLGWSGAKPRKVQILKPKLPLHNPHKSISFPLWLGAMEGLAEYLWRHLGIQAFKHLGKQTPI